MILYSIIILLVCLIFFYISPIIAKSFNLLDIPNTARKIHKVPVPKIGGIIIYSGLFAYLIILSEYENDFKFIIFISFFFILGLIDDLFDLSSLIRLLASFVFTIIFFYFFSELRINEMLIFKKIINLNFHFNSLIVIFITTLCVLLLQNAINMIDGINGLCAIFISICLAYLNIYYDNDFIGSFTIFLIVIFILFNLQNKIFLGNSGSYLLSSIIAYKILIINSFNLGITSEKIFLILIVPGLDMLRLFIVRIINKQNPFSADKNHLHHFLLNYYKSNQIKTLVTYLLISFVPLIISIIDFINDIVLIIIFVIAYFLIIYMLRSYKIKNK